MELSKNAQKIMELIKEMGAIELNQLVKAIEEEFGVSAASMVVSGWAAADAEDAWAAKSDSVNVELTDIGQQKIWVIKVIKEILGLGLKEAKDLVEKAPTLVKENCKFDDAEALKAKLEEVGAVVTLK